MDFDRRKLLASGGALAVVTGAAANSVPAVASRVRSGGTYANKGEKMYCAKGCHISTLNNDVTVGVEAKPSDFALVKGMHIGALECPFCKAPVTAPLTRYYFAI